MKKVFFGIFILVCSLSLFACDFKGASYDAFGMFTHNGYALTSFKCVDLTYSEANTIVSRNSSKASSTSTGLDEGEIDKLMAKYSSVTVKTKYWENDSKDPEEKSTNVTSVDMEKIFANNEYTISTGMLVKNIFISEEVLTRYEEENAAFDDKYAPFSYIYTYHKNEDDRFVLQVNDYAEISAENIGGVSALFIQQNETLYDDNNMISKFQSSFGMQFQTPGGTQNQGTVLEVEFIWNLKV